MRLFIHFALIHGSCVQEAEKALVEGQYPGECSDGADNDADGDYDCNDADCAGAPDCTAEESEPSSDTESGSDTGETSEAGCELDTGSGTEPENVGDTSSDSGQDSDTESGSDSGSASDTGSEPQANDFGCLITDRGFCYLFDDPNWSLSAAEAECSSLATAYGSQVEFHESPGCPGNNDGGGFGDTAMLGIACDYPPGVLATHGVLLRYYATHYHNALAANSCAGSGGAVSH